MAAYTLGVIYNHQRNILFVLFSHGIENSIEYFLLQSNIPTLTNNPSISLHATAQVSYYLFICYSQVLTNYQRQGRVGVYYSVLPTQVFFEKI